MPRRSRVGRALLGPALPLTTALLVAATAPAAGAQPAAPSAATSVGEQVRAALRVSHPELGHDRIGVRRGDAWYLRDALDGGPSRGFREDVAGWLPVAGDFDGDGDGSVSLFSAGAFRLRDRERGAVRLVRFGGPGDQPVVGDWDGDGVDTVGVFRAGRWYLRASNASAPAPSRAFSYGRAGDVPVVGDWDGNGTDDIGVRRGGTWFQRDAANGGPSSRSFSYGRTTDLPVTGDWDHDGRDTPGVFRAGTWYLREGSFESPSQVVRFGSAGDRPVVRRTRGLAPGVRHQVVREPSAPWVAHVATVELAAASSPETVLSQDRLQGTEPLSAMTRRAGAVLGVNGDFFLPSGRPVHLHANDGRLVQTPTILGRALGLDATGTQVSMGHPDVRATVTDGRSGASAALTRLNSGAPGSGALAGWTAAGWPLETAPTEHCYALLKPAGAPLVAADGTVETAFRSGTPRCGGPGPALPASGTLVAAEVGGTAAHLLRGLSTDAPVRLRATLGFPGAVDALGGNPRLVVDGAVAPDVDGTGSFFTRHARTAVGVTDDGRLLLVVVDGRSPGYSRGMTLRELAGLLQSLGARTAMNLDGGGSSEMVVNGVTANRPSDGRERGIANALVVLPGADLGQPPATAAAPLQPSLRGPSGSDGGSTGGLADALLRAGVPLPPELRRSADHFRAASSS